MREIKFRAWGAGLKDKRMFSAEELGADQMTLSADGRGFVNIHSTLQGSVFYDNKMIPLQYTGLKDKNGKEIYEGDIVRATANGNRKYQIVWQEDGLGHWWIADIKKDNLIPDKIPIYHNAIEVIGNIFENPELLEVIK